MEWFKIWHDSWLDGKIREWSQEDRCNFIDLLALASRSGLRDGTLRTAVGKPISRPRICDILKISLDSLNRTLEIGQRELGDNGKARLKVWEDGTIEVSNWAQYQEKPVRVAQKKRQSEATIFHRIIDKYPELLEDEVKRRKRQDDRLCEVQAVNNQIQDLRNRAKAVKSV